MLTDHQLLLRFSSSRCEDSFRELVDRHLNFVLSTAFRITRQFSVSEDISQQVFSQLSSRPDSVLPSLPLVAWLHRTTHSFSVSFVRAEVRRRKREQTATILNEMNRSHHEWEQLSPEIDEALNSLGKIDRAAILLRFYEKQSHAVIGERLGLTEDNARVRGSRALDKLRKILAKRGISTTTAALALALPTHCYGAQLAPAGLTHSISSTALVSSSGLGSTTLFFTTSMMKAKSTAFPILCLAIFAIPVWQQKTIAALEREHRDRSSLIHGGALSKSSEEAYPDRSEISSRKDTEIRALQLARIGNPVERDMELSKWASKLTNNEAILAVIQKLKSASSSTPALRALIAPHLTRQWALVDTQACLDFFFEEATEHHNNPFDAPRMRNGSSSYFGLIATTNPTGFENWVKSIPVEKFASLLTPVKLRSYSITPLVSADNSPGGAILISLVRFAPEHILKLVSQYPNYRESSFLLRHGSLYPALLARHGSADQLWPLVDHLPPSHERDLLLEKIASDSLASRDRSSALAEIRSGKSALRQITGLKALGEILLQERASLKGNDPEAQNGWLAQVSTFSEILNEVSVADDSLYDGVRAKMAALVVADSQERAIQWVQSIIDSEARLKTVANLAAILHSNGTYDPSQIVLKKGETPKSAKAHVPRTSGWQFTLPNDQPHGDLTLIGHKVLQRADLILDPEAPVETTLEKIKNAFESWDAISNYKNLHEKRGDR